MSNSVFDRPDIQEYRKLLPDDYADRLDQDGGSFEVGPVEPDPQALLDPSRRTVVRRQGTPSGKRYPFPIPNGWFVVAESRALAPGDVECLHAFGKDLVLYRSETGEARLIDAYCPHLGAHIGVGGKVEGDAIRCPFHGWRFDGESGRCSDIPYTDDDRIPARARARSYPTVERNQMIWAWHHLEAEPPFFEVPLVPEFDDPDWLPYELKTFEIATCVQEMAENDADYAHFRFVHGTPQIPETEMVVDGHYRRSASNGFVRESHGLGLAVLRIGDAFRFIASALPVDDEHVLQRWWFTAPRASGENAAKIIAEAFYTGVSQDLAIWENKRFQPKPLLTESEKNIAEFRRWAAQFYSGYDLEA